MRSRGSRFVLFIFSRMSTCRRVPRMLQHPCPAPSVRGVSARRAKSRVFRWVGLGVTAPALLFLLWSCNSHPLQRPSPDPTGELAQYREINPDPEGRHRIRRRQLGLDVGGAGQPGPQLPGVHGRAVGAAGGRFPHRLRVHRSRRRRRQPRAQRRRCSDDGRRSRRLLQACLGQRLLHPLWRGHRTRAASCRR